MYVMICGCLLSQIVSHKSICKASTFKNQFSTRHKQKTPPDFQIQFSIISSSFCRCRSACLLPALPMVFFPQTETRRAHCLTYPSLHSTLQRALFSAADLCVWPLGFVPKATEELPFPHRHPRSKSPSCCIHYRHHRPPLRHPPDPPHSLLASVLVPFWFWPFYPLSLRYS